MTSLSAGTAFGGTCLGATTTLVWWLKFSLIFFSSGTSWATFTGVTGRDRFSSFTLLTSPFSTAGTEGETIIAGDVVVVVVVHELPLLIFRIIRGESQPESNVFELVVTSSG